MHTRLTQGALLVLLVLGTIGCAHTVHPTEETMQPLAGALLRVSKAAEFTAHYDPAAPTLADEALLMRATQGDPALLTPFREYLLQAHQQDGHAVLLVCTKDGRTALLEDVGCTEGLDRPAWTDLSPCEFSLKASLICDGR